MKKSLVFLFVALPLLFTRAADPTPVRHRFLAVDESRGQLLLVNQRDPSQNWTLKLPMKCRDYQLIGSNQILLSGSDGYYVYDLGSRALVKELHDQRFAGAASVRRTANGHTFIGCNQGGLTFFELGPDDALLQMARFPELNTLRLMRLSPTGTMLFGANADQVVEAEISGKILARFKVPGAKHVYQALRLENGNVLAAAGYGHFLAEIDPQGKMVRKIEGPALPPGNSYHFFSGYQILKNGNIVQCNWTGHGAQDSSKGAQLVEIDPAGKLAWSWHDAALAGTVHGILLLDDLDPARLNDDSNGVLGPARIFRHSERLHW